MRSTAPACARPGSTSSSANRRRSIRNPMRSSTRWPPVAKAASCSAPPGWTKATTRIRPTACRRCPPRSRWWPSRCATRKSHSPSRTARRCSGTWRCSTSAATATACCATCRCARKPATGRSLRWRCAWPPATTRSGWPPTRTASASTGARIRACPA